MWVTDTDLYNWTYTRQLRSAKSSMKSNNWLISYVMDGLLGFILFRCSSYILQTPTEGGKKQMNNAIMSALEKREKICICCTSFQILNQMPRKFRCEYHENRYELTQIFCCWNAFVLAICIECNAIELGKMHDEHHHLKGKKKISSVVDIMFYGVSSKWNMEL